MTELWIHGLSAVALALLLNPMVQLVAGLLLLWLASERREAWRWLAGYADVRVRDLCGPGAPAPGAPRARRVAVRGRALGCDGSGSEPAAEPGVRLLADEDGSTLRVRWSDLPPPAAGEDVIVLGSLSTVQEASLYRETSSRLELRADLHVPVATVRRALQAAEVLRVLGSLCLAIGTAGTLLLCGYAARLAF